MPALGSPTTPHGLLDASGDRGIGLKVANSPQELASNPMKLILGNETAPGIPGDQDLVQDVNILPRITGQLC